MMKSINQFILILLLTFFYFKNSNAQIAIANIDTINYYGTTDTLDYMPIIINTNGNVVVSGNQKMSSTQYDATTADQTINAVNNWITSFNMSNQKAFMTCNTHDSNGNIISAGAIRTPTSNGTDMLIICQTSGGSISWTYIYDGAGNLNDVASSVCVDPNDNIYVTGVSDGGNPTYMDYVTIKFSPSGTKLWETAYDYGNYFDIPTSVSYDNMTNNVVVSGSSGTSYTDYDFATVIYDDNSGSQISSNRTTSNGSGEDKVFGMVTDNSGNIYIAGSTYNGTDFDAQLVKLDTSLTTVYTRTLDFYGQDDVGINLTLDDSSNVIMVGTTNIAATKRELFIAKYNNNGSLIWKKTRSAEPVTNSNAEGIKVIAKNHNEIFIGGNFEVNGNQDIVLLRYDKNGWENMIRTYNGPSNGDEKFMDMTIDNNKIFVSARSYNGSNDDNIVVTFSYRDIYFTPIIDTIANAHFVKDEVIVRFNKSALKMNKIDNREILYGTLSDFVDDSTALKIQIMLDPIREFDLDAKAIQVRKLNNVFTSSDTISISRIGDTIRAPEFYASLVLTLPSNINTQYAANNLDKVKPDICWSQLNNIYTLDWVPNDTIYSKQTSLHTSTLYPNAHINVEKAWDYTTGQSFVRTGIYDTGIETNLNNDLYGVITEQHDFLYGTVSNYAPDYIGHGTQVAGIVGAKSNNINGVAGIAGGGANGSGAHVVIMRIGQDQLATDVNIKTAFITGAAGSNVQNCFALHIMNCSFGKKNVAKVPEFVESVEFANQNGVALVASRGNHQINIPSIPINSTNQPATLRPRITMNVGASGENGENHVENVNGTKFTTFRGKGVDFMAGGALNNVRTPYNFNMSEPGPPGTPPQPTVAPNSYTTFGGTSSAAPHVTGVVALMMSYRNLSYPYWDNLVHEDCEAILKRSATDVTVSAAPYYEAVGNDSISGYGRINADSALSCLQPKYKIRHIDLTHHSSSASTSTTTVVSNKVRYFPGNSVFPAGSYSVDIIEYQVTYSYPFSGETFIDAWPLHKASVGRPLGDTIELSEENNYCEIISANNTSATLKTYAYKFIAKATSPFTNYGGQITPGTSILKAAFSLYTIGDSLDLVGLSNKENIVDYFNVYPNPSNGSFTIGFSSNNETNGSLKLINIMGSVILDDQNINVHSGINRLNLSLSNLPRGVYFVNLDIKNNKKLVKKIIIE